MDFLPALIHISVAFLGVLVFIKILILLHVPTPALLGSLSYFSVLNILGYTPPLTAVYVSMVGQFVIGINLSSRFTRDSLALFKQVPIPTLVLTSATYILSIISGFLFLPFSQSDMKSVMMAIAPGGLAEMLALGQSMNADTVVITFMQTVRLISCLICMPLLVKFLNRNINIEEANLLKVQSSSRSPLDKRELIPLVICAFLLTYQFAQWEVPAGFVLGPLFASTCYLLIRNKDLTFPKTVFYFGHICIGFGSSSNINATALAAFGELFIPTIFIVSFNMLCAILLGTFLSKMTGWDKATCQLAAAPGGLMQMAITASELKGNVPIVIFMQMVRLVGLIILWPILITLFF